MQIARHPEPDGARAEYCDLHHRSFRCLFQAACA
jgi:hypothetical protein